MVARPPTPNRSRWSLVSVEVVVARQEAGQQAEQEHERNHRKQQPERRPRRADLQQLGAELVDHRLLLRRELEKDLLQGRAFRGELVEGDACGERDLADTLGVAAGHEQGAVGCFGRLDPAARSACSQLLALRGVRTRTAPPTRAVSSASGDSTPAVPG